MKRIFITGMGLISCKGNELESFWSQINNSQDHHPTGVKIPLDIPKIVDNNILRRMDRFSRLLLTASKLAIEGSNLSKQEHDPFRVGTVFNTVYGPINSNLAFAHKMVADGVDLVSPTVFSATVCNAGAGHTCLNLSLKGASTMLMGSHSLAYACSLLKAGKADAILSGGVDEYCSELEECFQNEEYITKDNEYICRPLDQQRSGMRVLEGAAVLVLEKEDAPFWNSEKAIAEILGCGSALTYINPAMLEESIEDDVFIQAMIGALEDAHIHPDHIDGIFMAANGSQLGDQAEAAAIRNIFGKRATTSLPVTSIKGAIGETLGASLSMNTVAAVLGLQKGIIPPTIGYQNGDGDNSLNVIANNGLKGDYNCFMVNGYDINGGVYSLIIGAKADEG